MQNKIDYKNVKKIGLVTRPNVSLDKEILKLQSILFIYKVELVLFKESSKILDLPKYELDDLFKISDFVISLGGDGTLISLCRKACEYDKAVLGIHAGHLGFLTDFKVDEAENFFQAFFQGEFRIEKPYLLSVFLEDKQGKILEKLAFNDVVISKDNKVSMAHIEVFRKEKKFNEYFGDGLIVATPAGSTAYNLSANGPIVYTLAQAFILTPVCSHSLTQRPIVLPKGFEIEIMAKDCMLCIDGQENYKMNDFKSIKVGLSDKNVALIHPKNRDYFQILKEKIALGKLMINRIFMKENLGFKKAELEISKGFTVFTGLSGAGKSVLFKGILSAFSLSESEAKIVEIELDDELDLESFGIESEKENVFKLLKEKKHKVFYQ
ncbi:ATP-NAD kinase, putative [Campylobacter jejuni subsp. jejuni 414]|nr:ATP-NAD kinase, putative [Campylobacter jejuni subsp. jejuni 414]